MLNLLSVLVLFIVSISGLYLWVIALAGVRAPKLPKPSDHLKRFAIAVPAHNEESIIGQTVAALRSLDYPSELYKIYIVADFCSDQTADEARSQGAICFERKEGERGGKGNALIWLFKQIQLSCNNFDAIVIFDADTQVEPGFLKAMNNRLNQGALVIQGQHIISNPRAGWFPALTWAMMTIDNRFSNQGRSNLNLSAKHMGDSICFRSEILENLGWGSGLTEDYEFRLRLLLEGIRIQYEPSARGYGQAPLFWKEAQAQRQRWARGMADAGKQYRQQLLSEGVRENNWSKLDGALMTFLPSYSTLSLISIAILIFNLVFMIYVWHALIILWAFLAFLCFIYPLFGLILVKAPAWAYLAIISGPIFMFWRTWLNLRVRLFQRDIPWVRTPHKGTKPIDK